MSTVFLEAPRRLVDVTIDGQTVRVPEGATQLEACRQQGIDRPPSATWRTSPRSTYAGCAWWR